MSMIIKGPYGYYISYINEDGKKSGIKIFDNVYYEYYEPGYFTDSMIEELLKGKTCEFSVPKKSGSGDIKVIAKIVPYTTKNGKNTKIIQFDTDQVTDQKIIKSNSDKIIASYYSGSRFDYTRPQKVVDSLDLSTVWKTFAKYQKLGSLTYGNISVYKARGRKSDNIELYFIIDGDECKQVSDIELNAYVSKARKEENEKAEEENRKISEMNEVKKELLSWVDSVKTTIFNGQSKIDFKDVIKNSESLIETISVADIDNRVIGLLNSHSTNILNSYFSSTAYDIKYYINTSNYTDTTYIDKIKNTLLKNIKIYVEYLKIKIVRNDLLNEYKTNGLDAMTSSIDIDTAMNLGYFPTVKKILVRYGANAPEYIINEMYKEELNITELKNKLLNLLKIYYDFYDMPEKDRKSVAKWVAVHKLSEYYDKMREFDDDEILDILISNSRDSKLLKPILEGIAGTRRADMLKNKTYYFEKHGRLRNNIILYKPIDLLDGLKDCIKEFNAASDVAILTNIELDSDESFIFQFYTYSESSGDKSGFDGRRMLNLTRIYNRNHPDKKIGFNFDNSDINDSDDED